jgi:pSer/pThr/pTyr-binding forkhead associated (FHA) protein
MADIPVLHCIAGAIAGQRIAVPDGGLDLGRSPDNHVVITDDGVSRFHARLLYDNGALWLQDAGSRNGIFVNDKRLTGHRALKVGDEIRIAEHTFKVTWDDDTPAAPPRPPVTPEPPPSKSTSGGDATTETDSPPKRRWFWPFD